MTSSDFTKSVIALACWNAAKGELHPIMLSVCQVFSNRAKAEEKEVYEVASWWLVEHPPEFPDEREPQFQQLLAKLDNVLDGLVPDRTDGALWFVSKDKLQPDMLKAFKISAQIGQFYFVRGK
jgi:hypothetical protein